MKYSRFFKLAEQCNKLTNVSVYRFNCGDLLFSFGCIMYVLKLQINFTFNTSHRKYLFRFINIIINTLSRL